MKKGYLYFLIICFYIVGCSDSEVYDKNKNEMDTDEFTFFEERTVQKSNNPLDINNFNVLEDLEIIFLEVDKKNIFFRSKSDTNKVYYSNCVIDSAFLAPLTSEVQLDKIYMGYFYPTEIKNVRLTFVSIFSYNKKNNKYQNSYNTYYFSEKTFLDIKIVNNLINNSNVLFISNYEGSGNFLDINLIARNKNRLDDITPEIPPLSQGEYFIDSSRILLMEGLAAWEILESKEKATLEMRKLDTIPIIDFQERDKIIKFKRSGNRVVADSKIYVCSWTGVIHLQIDEPNNGLLLNFDPEYFKRNFNQLIPLKTGFTSLELIDTDFNFVINNIKIIIN